MDTLRFNVATLLKERTGVSRRYRLNVPPERLGNLRVVAPVQGEVTFLRLGARHSEAGAILVLGHLTTTVQLECSRCLAPVSEDVAFDLEAPYYPRVDVITGQPVAPHQDDMGFDLTPNHELDLSEAVRQYIELTVPMQPLCAERCAGLCPVCGRNQNETPCHHETAEVDPRLAPLQALLAGEGRAQATR